jgi:hypothetical protein
MRTYKMTEEEIKAILEQMNFKGENKVWMIMKIIIMKQLKKLEG